MNVYTTDEGGDMARFGIPTGNSREVQTANMFSGTGVRMQIEIEAFKIVPPDLVEYYPGIELSNVPSWISEKLCGIGESLGKEWI